MNINSISTTKPTNSEIEIGSEKKTTQIENKHIKKLYGDQSKAEMLSVYMSRMNSFYDHVKDVIDEKNQNLTA